MYNRRQDSLGFWCSGALGAALNSSDPAKVLGNEGRRAREGGSGWGWGVAAACTYCGDTRFLCGTHAEREGEKNGAATTLKGDSSAANCDLRFVLDVIAVLIAIRLVILFLPGRGIVSPELVSFSFMTDKVDAF